MGTHPTLILVKHQIGPERRRISRPFMEIVLERVAMESQQISLIGDHLGADIKASGEAGGLERVI